MDSIKEIDSKIQRQYEQYWDTLRERAKPSKKILVVEGDDDRLVIQELLTQTDPRWNNKIVIAAAGGRDKVLNKLNKNPGWFGLVDRDTWDRDDVRNKQSDSPNLTVTDGWCLENHFCDIKMLAASFGLAEDQVPVDGGALEKWVSYGIIRWTLQRSYDALSQTRLPSDYGRPGRMASEPHDPDSVRKAIEERGYAAGLEKAKVDALLQQLSDRKVEVAALSEVDRWLHGVPGKIFFSEVVVPALNGALGQASADVWRGRLAEKYTAWPPSLTTMAARLLK